MKFVYKIIPLALPVVTRNGIVYHCTEKFRTNFNGALGDVWLIYQTSKKETWNMSIISRKKSTEFNRGNLLEKFAHNDLDTVWRYAFDNNFISQNGGQLKDDVPFRTEGPDISEILSSTQATIDLQLSSDYFIPNKVRKILSGILDTSSASLDKFHTENGFELLNNAQINRRLANGCEVRLDVSKFRSLVIKQKEKEQMKYDNCSSFKIR